MGIAFPKGIVYNKQSLLILNLKFIVIVTGGIPMEIGPKIKELRVQKGLTQEELADRSELSKGFISQVERDLNSPSIATLVDILQCLGTNLEEFFAGTGSEQVVFKNSDYFEKIDTDMHNKIEWVIPNAQKNQMEPILLTLEPGGSTYPDNTQ